MVTKTELKSPLSYHVSCNLENSTGLEITLCHISRHRIAFRVHTPGVVLRASENLPNFRIIKAGDQVYSGRATIKNIVDTGADLTCEATLEGVWVDFKPEELISDPLSRFMSDSLKNHVFSDFKVAVADLQVILQDLLQWTDQIALHVLEEPARNRQNLEQDYVQQTSTSAFPTLASCFERFELAASRIPHEETAAYAAYVKRQLHPLVLCAPFMYRTYRKPLGYAGDYEMVCMMMRDPFEGSSPFAKVLNAFFLSTPPVKAHQNRISELKSMLMRELVRGKSLGRRMRVLNIGSGPAKEIEDLIAATELTDHVDFTLVDFNQETLNYTERVLTRAVTQNGRAARVHLLRRSVAQLLKEAGRKGLGLGAEPYDVVYCAGLFDYLPKIVCRQLLSLGYSVLAPFGLLLATNVDDYNPSRHWMELAVDWHLLYRNARELEELLPPEVDGEDCRTYSENSGINVFVEARKTPHV